MTYTRVLPRDLFNEANLLKCIGKLVIELENKGNYKARILEETCQRFFTEQDESDGSISVTNLTFMIGRKPVRLYRPLNARAAWPLYAGIENAEGDMDAVPVFDDIGELSEEFVEAIQ